MIEAQRLLPDLDERAEEMLAEALETMPKNLKRRMLLTYLGFPYYDVATLPLLRNESLTEFDPVKVDRISPDDARSIREGNARHAARDRVLQFRRVLQPCLSRERLPVGAVARCRAHGRSGMLDARPAFSVETCRHFKREAFHAILDEEQRAERCNQRMIDEIRREVVERLP